MRDSGELTVGGLRRTFTVTLPDGGAVGRPLVLVLHGNSPDAGGRVMREWTTFDARAGAWGVAVAYPDGHGGCWADGRGVTTADEAGVDDLRFLRGLIAWAADRHGTDPERTIVAGMSNGAFMAHRLALAASDQVAVLAAVAGTLPAALADRQPTHAVSALLIHGSADPIAPIGGGWSRHRGPGGELRGRTLSLRETAERWRVIDRCPPFVDDPATRTTVDGGVGGTRVAMWTVVGGGHSWPGTAFPGTAFPGQDEPQEFDAAEEICRFAVPLALPATGRRF